MTSINLGWAIVSVSPFYRLPLADGRRVFMDFHHFCGPTFYRDRHGSRIIADWYDDPLICAALDWFVGRRARA